MGHHHVAERAGRLVEAGTHVEAQRLGHVDLHMVDEVAIPDRLEQLVRKPEREDVLRGLLAEEVIDAKDLLFVEHFVQGVVQRPRGGEVATERLLHDDAGARGGAGPGQPLRHAAEPHLWPAQAHPVLFRAGNSLGEAGFAAAAADYFHHLQTTATKRLGPHHPDTLTARGNTAYWQGETGDLVAAINGLKHVLTDQANLLGPDHPDTLTTRHRLILWHGIAGKTDGMLGALEQLLTDRIRVLGTDHPDTLSTRSSIANSHSITRNHTARGIQDRTRDGAAVGLCCGAAYEEGTAENEQNGSEIRARSAHNTP